MVTRGEREQTLEIYFSMPYLCLVSRTIKEVNFVVIQ